MFNNERRPRKSARIMVPWAKKVKYYEKRFKEEFERIADQSPWRNMSEKAWTVMLVKQGIVSRQDGAKILSAILELGKNGPKASTAGSILPFDFGPMSLEKALRERIGEDVASSVNIGKTLPEPLNRLQLRDKLIDVLESILEFRKELLELAKRNIDAVMPGYTHFRQAQPTTFAHYIVSVHDAIERAMTELEGAYKITNLNSLGGGALAGTSWPIDRNLIVELLGFDGLLENSNDCVSSGDFNVSTATGLTNLMIAISRFTMDLNLWGMEEIKMIDVRDEYCSTSSMMPQKKNYSRRLEHARVDSSAVISRLMELVVLAHSEPYAELILLHAMARPLLEALCTAERTLGILSGLISTLIVNKETMLKFARQGFSCATELTNTIMRKKGLSFRKAHTIVAILVGMAEESGRSATEVTSKMLNEAAIEVTGEPVGLSDEDIRQALDPVHFVQVHNSVGGVAPSEVKRMTKDRIKRLEGAKKRHVDRLNKLEQARKRLDAEISLIIQSV